MSFRWRLISPESSAPSCRTIQMISCEQRPSFVSYRRISVAHLSTIHRVFDGTVPPHFYGELTKTEEGCQTLLESGHFAEFAQFIRQHGLEAKDVDLINKLKSVLWVVVRRIRPGEPGCSCSSTDDRTFTRPDICRRVTLERHKEATRSWPRKISLVTSFRSQSSRLFSQYEGRLIVPGSSQPSRTEAYICVLLNLRTCFYVLGLIASTRSGSDFVAEHGWESTLTATGEPTGLAFPSDINKFVFVRSSFAQHRGSYRC